MSNGAYGARKPFPAPTDSDVLLTGRLEWNVKGINWGDWDDMLGRKIAKLQNIKITGTAGILLKAKKEKLIKELAPLLDNLIKEGFYISEKLIVYLLEIAEEKR